MTKFEQIGIDYQYDATNIQEAKKFFTYSCNYCCSKGMKISCDRCAIANTHSLIINYLTNTR